MTVTIISESKHALIKRKEVLLQIEHANKATPKNDEARKLVAEKAKVDEKFVTVKRIRDDFGSTKAIVKAYVYEDEKTKSAVEDIKKKKILADKMKAQHEANKKAKEEAAKPAQ